MRFVVVTLFPELFAPFATHGVTGRAITSGRVTLETVDPRDFTTNRHRSTDDVPYGGGSGMVMLPDPVVSAMESVAPRPHRVLLCPQGEPFVQRTAQRLAALEDIMLVCGRYEGFDDRIREHVDEEISLGDFVLTGGEIGALAVLDAVARLLPGVLGNPDSAATESHSDGLLEYPQFTRPATFRGRPVPDVLVSGDHGRIARWRRQQQLLRTRERRPDLLARAALGREDVELLRAADRDAKDGSGETT